MKIVYISPDEVFDYSIENFQDLSDAMELIAENKDTGTEVFLSILNGMPYIQVYMDNDLLDEMTMTTEEECSAVTKSVYDEYLGDAAEIISKELDVDDEDDEPEMELAEQLDAVDDRDQELGNAVEDFMSILAPNLEEIAGTEYDDIMEDVLDLVCEYMYRVRGISVYRPMFLEDEDIPEGYFTEFPYPEIDFDSED